METENRELVMYGRRFGCGDQVRAQFFLHQRGIPYRFVDIGEDRTAAQRLLGWVGHLSVPTLVVAAPGAEEPIVDPAPLDPRRRTRGQDRATLITEPDDAQLETFLRRNELFPVEGPKP